MAFGFVTTSRRVAGDRPSGICLPSDWQHSHEPAAAAREKKPAARLQSASPQITGAQITDEHSHPIQRISAPADSQQATGADEPSDSTQMGTRRDKGIVEVSPSQPSLVIGTAAERSVQTITGVWTDQTRDGEAAPIVGRFEAESSS